NFRGCSAYRCNRGFAFGDGAVPVHDPNQSYTVTTVGNIASSYAVLGAWADRCNTGVLFGHSGAGMLAGGAITSLEQTGVPDPAPISNMQWSAGVVTVTTPIDHGIGADGLIMLNSVSPPTFIPAGAGLPDGSGNGMVSISQRTSNTFKYNLAVDPGAAFVS